MIFLNVVHCAHTHLRPYIRARMPHRVRVISRACNHSDENNRHLLAPVFLLAVILLQRYQARRIRRFQHPIDFDYRHLSLELAQFGGCTGMEESTKRSPSRASRRHRR
ncbi:MAG: hypothetical protein GPOALKHO_000361 [Sodalis sp.]|nr:MAG: hypothetical protein GPOALKHO_000361 [Sodalis sp.]